MVLQPFILIFIVYEICKQLPISTRILRAFNYLIITPVSKVWQRCHSNYSIFNMLQFLETKWIRCNSYLGVTDFDHLVLHWTYKFYSLSIRSQFNVLIGLFDLSFIIVLLNMRQQGHAIGHVKVRVFVWQFLESLKKVRLVKLALQSLLRLQLFKGLTFFLFLLMLSKLMKNALLDKDLRCLHSFKPRLLISIRTHRPF